MSTLNEGQKQKIVIAATFTAEPIEDALSFWLQQLELPSEIDFAPYNQVFQQLLDPSSLFSLNQQGINVVLVRLEDWQRVTTTSKETAAKLSESASREIAQNSEEFLLALTSVTARQTTPYVVCLCPASPAVLADPSQRECLQVLEAQLVSQLSSIKGVYCVSSAELAVYPVEHYYDAQADKIGHIPFTPVFFTALATAIARKIYAIKYPPYKVIVLDCDNTLWKGIVGEDGVRGIEVTQQYQALQEFMIAQQTAGMLLCLCSKNNETDVVEVFQQRQEMRLQREQIVSWRINWLPKSENLKSLASELNLGLDSFIFIDDNPVECAEVQANCPGVLTLNLPIDSDIVRFLQHVWAFDRLKVTQEDQQRTALYKQNLDRERFRQSSMTIADFIAGLGLKIEISEVSDNLARVAQLTQRTNQFNFTTIRRSEAQIQQLCSANYECRVVQVSDRFGDYGLVGVMIFLTTAEALQVDTFLLSCRVLGRGVEHAMIAHLGEIAQERGLKRVEVAYIPTAKNQPALNFLNSIGTEFKQQLEQEYRFYFPVEFAAALAYKPQAAQSIPSDAVVAATTSTPPTLRKSPPINLIANELYNPEQILQSIDSQQRQQQLAKTTRLKSFVAPKTETQKILAQIWVKLLRLEEVSIQDNFFELGGTSVLAVRLFTQIEDKFGKTLPLPTLLTAPTIEQLANIIQEQEGFTTTASLVPLQTGGNKPPLFCIYGIFLYQDLATHLGAEQPVYGVYIPEEVELLKAGQLEPANALVSVADLARLYLQEIKKLQPVGPYFLAGESFGGLVALEMAQQLRQQGEQTSLLVLFDTEAPGKTRKLPLTEKFSRHLGNLLREGPSYALKKVGLRLESSRKRLLKIFSRTRILPIGIEAVTNDVRDQVRQQAINNYKPHPYPGNVVLFRAMERSGFEIDAVDSVWGWRPLVTGELTVHHVPGDHIGIIKEPHVRVLASKLKASLEQAQQTNLEIAITKS